jgi:heterotetrameric sarcosine oxidase gamma subunit
VAEPFPSWTPRSPWAGVIPRADAEGTAAEVAVSPRDNLGLATVIASGDTTEQLRERFAALYGLEAPTRPIVARGRALDLAWAGPERWLAVSAERGVAGRLAEELKGLAAVSDQSDARAVLRLSGPKAREILAKGCPIDLHPRAFRPGDTALTVIAHVGVQIWQVDDAPTFDLLVARSVAASFWRWLSRSAEEFGLRRRPVPP